MIDNFNYDERDIWPYKIGCYGLFVDLEPQTPATYLLATSSRWACLNVSIRVLLAQFWAHMQHCHALLGHSDTASETEMTTT